MRRHDRELKDETLIQDFLAKAEYGVVGTSVDDQPFLTSLLFYYDPMLHSVFLHTARQGRLLKNIEKNPNVCFSVAALGRYLPADVALEFSVEYQSVISFGTASIVEDPLEAERALLGLLEKHFPHLHPGKDYRSITKDELKKTAIIKIQIEAWSAKAPRANVVNPTLASSIGGPNSFKTPESSSIK